MAINHAPNGSTVHPEEEMYVTIPLKKLVPRRVFARRFGRGVAVALGFVLSGLALGAVGYHVFEKLGWLDATLNASMLLAGEGPIAPLHTTAGKIFATWYAIFSGVVFLSAISTMMAPVAHLFLHKFHMELGEEAERVRDPA
jgi:hypothetical protein